MSRFVRRSVATTGALLLACLTACGSTVSLSGQQPPGGLAPGGADGLALGTSTTTGLPQATATEATGSSGLPGATPADGQGASTSIGSGDTTNPVVGGGGGPTSSSQLVPKQFKLGVMVSSNANLVLAGFGSGTADAKGAEDASKAIVAYINSHGGIAHRPVVLAVNNVDATASPQSESETACAQWTQDDHVTLAVPSSAVEDNDVMRTCLGKAGVPALLGPIYSNTLASGFASSPLWAELETLSNDSYARTYVRGLASQGFFASGKVGVVYYDKPPFTTTLQNVLLPELKAAGVKSVVTAGASISGASDLSNGGAQMSSAVLKFRSAGVTKVLFFEPWVGYFSFLDTAKSQGYNPQYGLSSQEAPEVVRQLGLISRDMLAGAHIVSWTPIGDVGNYAAASQGPNTKICAAIFKSAGFTPAGTGDRFDYALQYGGCEALLLLQKIYKNAGDRLTAADFTRGLNALGNDVPLVLRPHGSFTSSKHYGVTEYWNGHFDNNACGCFVYDGGPHPVF